MYAELMKELRTDSGSLSGGKVVPVCECDHRRLVVNVVQTLVRVVGIVDHERPTQSVAYGVAVSW